MGTVRRIAALAALVGMLAASAPAQASPGTWSKPVPISRGFAEDASIAGNGRGDAVIGYSGAHAAWASQRRAHGPFAEPVRLASRRIGRARVFAVGMDRDGDAFVGWVETQYHDTFYRPDCCVVRVAIARPGGPFLTQTVSTPGEATSYPEMRVGGDGTAVVRWTVGQLALQAVGRPGTGFAQPRVVATSTEQGLLAVGGDGRPLLLGVRSRASRDTFWARDGDRQGRFGPRYRLYRASKDDSVALESPVQLQPDGAGGIATWVGPGVAKPYCCESDEALYALSWKRGGRQVIRQKIGTAVFPVGPTLATGPGGSAVIGLPDRAFNEFPEDVFIHLAIRRRDGMFHHVPGVAGWAYCCDYPPSLSLAVNRHAGVVVAWEGGTGPDYEPGSAAAVRDPDGSYGPIRHWSGDLASWRKDGYGFTGTPAAVIDSAGRATVLMRGDRLVAVDYEPGGSSPAG